MILIVTGDEYICVVGTYVLLYAVKTVAGCIAGAAVAAAQVYGYAGFHGAGVGGDIITRLSDPAYRRHPAYPRRGRRPVMSCAGTPPFNVSLPSPPFRVSSFPSVTGQGVIAAHSAQFVDLVITGQGVAATAADDIGRNRSLYRLMHRHRLP